MKNNIEQNIIMGKLSNDKLVENSRVFSDILSIRNVGNVHINYEDLEKKYTLLQLTACSTSVKEITSSNKTISKVVIFVKKIIRKLMKWYIEPVCEQQSIYNCTVNEVIQEQIRIQSEILTEIKNLKNQLEKIENTDKVEN